MEIPNDGAMLLSFINMKLRDGEIGLNEFCEEEGISREEIEEKLAAIGYFYSQELNKFI